MSTEPTESTIQDQLKTLITEVVSFKTEQQAFRLEQQQFRTEQQQFRSEITNTLANLGNQVNSISLTVTQQQETINSMKTEIQGIDAAVASQEKDISCITNDTGKADVRIRILEGKLKHQEIVLNDMQKQINYLEAKQMSSNVIFTYIAEAEDEDQLATRAKLVEFMKTNMKMSNDDIAKVKFDQVYRVGRKTGNDPRRILAKMSGDTNPADLFRFKKNINYDDHQMYQQYPPAIVEKRTVLQNTMTKEFANVPVIEKRISGDKLIVKGKVITPGELSHRNAPAPYDENRIDWLNKSPRIRTSETVMDKGNYFKAYAARISSQQEAQVVKDLVLADQCGCPSTHLACAYILNSGSGSVIKHKDDDREYGAGRRMLQLLEDTKCYGIIVLVSRWFSGVELGPTRFTHYQNATRAVLQKLLHG